MRAKFAFALIVVAAAGIVATLATVRPAEPLVAGDGKAAKPREKQPAAGTDAAPAPADPDLARCVGLSVAVPDKEKGHGSLAFGVMAGSSVHFLTPRTEHQILNVSREHSELLEFSDDRGTDLRATGRGGDQWLWPFADLSKDAHEAGFQIKSEATPARGARSITVRATVGFLAGADPKQIESPGVAIEKGSKIAAQGETWKLKDVKRSGGRTTFTIECEKGFDGVRSMSFSDGGGRAIEHESSGRMSWTVNGKGTHSQTITLKADVQSVTVRLEVWGRVDVILVPVAAEVGVGL